MFSTFFCFSETKPVEQEAYISLIPRDLITRDNNEVGIIIIT